MVELEIGQLEQMLDVPQVPGHEVVHADDMAALLDETVAEMGSEKTRRTRYEHSFLFHSFQLIFMEALPTLS
jgi:hypothetical protein